MVCGAQWILSFHGKPSYGVDIWYCARVHMRDEINLNQTRIYVQRNVARAHKNIRTEHRESSTSKPISLNDPRNISKQRKKKNLLPDICHGLSAVRSPGFSYFLRMHILKKQTRTPVSMRPFPHCTPMRVPHVIQFYILWCASNTAFSTYTFYLSSAIITIKGRQVNGKKST